LIRVNSSYKIIKISVWFFKKFYFLYKDYGVKRTKEINRSNVNLGDALKITSSKMKNSQTSKITNHIFARVSNGTKTYSSKNLNLNEILEKNKDEIKIGG